MFCIGLLGVGFHRMHALGNDLRPIGAEGGLAAHGVRRQAQTENLDAIVVVVPGVEIG
jgi:hypothetical protein